MTERERLIELIKKGETEFIMATGDCDLLDYLADHLLSNGVIVPPCKVGDAVYYYKAEIEEICPAKVIGIFNNFYTPSMPLWITIEYESKLIGRQEEKMTSEVFDLLCRSTKDEALKALKERSEGK